MTSRPPVIAMFGLLVLVLAGCATHKPRDAGPVPRDPREIPIFDGRTGSRVSWDRLVIGACSADAAILGENHGHPLGLDTAAALWEDVLARTTSASLAMEFFERDQQVALDDYLAGIIDEKAFRDRTRRTPQGYPPGHQRMVEAARAAGRPVIAANAPRPYVRLARTDGFERLGALTVEQRRLLRVPDELLAGRYRSDFDAMMSPPGPADPAHPPMARSAVDAMYRAQSVWDWTMGESVARELGVGRRPVVLVVGRFHSDFFGGTPQVVRRLRPGARVVTVSFVDSWSGVLRSADRDRADYVVYVGPSPPPPAR